MCLPVPRTRCASPSAVGFPALSPAASFSWLDADVAAGPPNTQFPIYRTLQRPERRRLRLRPSRRTCRRAERAAAAAGSSALGGRTRRRAERLRPRQSSARRPVCAGFEIANSGVRDSGRLTQGNRINSYERTEFPKRPKSVGEETMARRFRSSRA